MKKITFLIIFVLFLLSLSLISYKFTTKKHPEIKASFIVSKLTDDDFNSIGTDESKKITTKEDFRKVYISVEFINCKNLSDRKITIPDFKNLMNSYDIERYWYGQSTKLDTPTEDAAYTYDIMFLSKNLTDEQIKSIFKDSQAIITWKNKNTNENSIKINISDIIVFN